ncbi:MAG: signal peptidase I [Sandaracinaceae bacterium]
MDAPKTKPVVKRKATRSPWMILSLFALFCVANPCSLALVMRVGLYEGFQIDGPSMAPAYQDGDRVVVSKFQHGLFLPFADEQLVTWGEPALGEVLIVHSPADDVDIIKRVIGLPGDRIAIRDNVVIRNGVRTEQRGLGRADGWGGSEIDCFEERMDGHRWAILYRSFGMPDNFDEVVVPEGHVFVLGDHRDRSSDSRNPRVGFIPFERIKGRVGMRYYAGDERIECPEP